MDILYLYYNDTKVNETERRYDKKRTKREYV